MNSAIKQLAFQYRALLMRYDTAYQVRFECELGAQYYNQAKTALENFEHECEDDLELIREFADKYLG